MRIKYYFIVNTSTNEKRVYVSDVLAMYEHKVSLLKKTKIYLVLQDESNSLKHLEYIGQNNIIEFISVEEPTNWITVNKYISNFYNDDGSPHFILKLYNLKCYQWMIEENHFFSHIIEDSNISLTLLYSKLPELLAEKIRIVNQNKLCKYPQIPSYRSYLCRNISLGVQNHGSNKTQKEP